MIDVAVFALGLVCVGGIAQVAVLTLDDQRTERARREEALRFAQPRRRGRH